MCLCNHLFHSTQSKDFFNFGHFINDKTVLQLLVNTLNHDVEFLNNEICNNENEVLAVGFKFNRPLYLLFCLPILGHVIIL